MEITVIKAKTRVEKRLRVAAYCRVSREGEEQESSIENQMAHYEKLIKGNPNYEYAGVYYDYGISGYKEKRPGFQKMMADARARKIDLILTKSITRFARNTDTILKATRELKELGIGVFFELQQMNTLTQEGELLMTVYAASAQGESDHYSTLAKMTYRRKYESGEPVQYLERSFGYTTDDKGAYIVHPEEAPWVKRIFLLCVDGYSLAQIARYLNKEGIQTKGGAAFTESTVKRILENEIYKGDYIMHKHFVNAERRLVTNRGEVTAWYIRNDHPSIVSRKLWDAAQNKKKERQDYLSIGSVIGVLDDDTYPYKDHIFCAECGYPLYRKIYSNGNRVCWCCSGHKRFSKQFCKGINVPDSVIRDWGITGSDFYINVGVDDLGKKRFKYSRESTWKKTHKMRKPNRSILELTTENYPYKDHLFCAACGSKLTRHIQTANQKVFWICSGQKHKGKSFCKGVRVPDERLHKFRDLKTDIYIRKDENCGKESYSYSSKKQ